MESSYVAIIQVIKYVGYLVQSSIIEVGEQTDSTDIEQPQMRRSDLVEVRWGGLGARVTNGAHVSHS